MLDGDEWTVNGQKVENSGAQHPKFGILMARSDPEQPQHEGISYFMIDMDQPEVDVRPLREMTGDIAFNEVLLSNARGSDADRLGEQDEGWRIGMTTLSHERDPDNAGSGSGFVFGGANQLPDSVVDEFNAAADLLRRQRLVQMYTLRNVVRWSTEPSMATVKAGGQPGPEVSTFKVIGAEISCGTRGLGLEAMGPNRMLWGDDTPTGGQFHAYCIFTPAMSIAGGITRRLGRQIVGHFCWDPCVGSRKQFRRASRGLGIDWATEGIVLPGRRSQFSLRCWLNDVEFVGRPDAIVHYRYRDTASVLWKRGFAYGSHRPWIARLLKDAGKPTPPKIAGWKSWAMLIAKVPTLRSRNGWAAWIWIAANRFGQIVGSVRHRIVML
ncbi:MAG: hypothetical protein ACJAR2_000770 [Ilumatobacter sp.]